ncbi:MAG: RIP metalloprotease RseP, partial [Pseudooceanicola sp.]|nr:RIP metalloprotease RseP [Pseudooceanicola sp.]
TMHGAPLWARTATVAAGPVFNFVLSILIFAAIFMARGMASDPLTVGEIRPLPQGSYELREGDQILAVGGIDVPRFDEDDNWDGFRAQLPASEPLDYSVRRGESEVSVQGPFLYPPYITSVAPRSAAMDAGLEPGDVITQVDGAPVFAFDQLKTQVEASDGRALQVQVWRNGQTLDFTLVPRGVDEPQQDGGFARVWRIGVVSSMAFEPAREPAGIWRSLTGAVAQMAGTVTTSVSGLWHIVTGRIDSCNISGPLGIAKASGDTASLGAQSFIWFIASLSTAVGLLNLFPIPALDGGHLMFYAYEAVARRAPSDLAMRVLMSVGIAMLLTLMAFALYNDATC